MFFFLFQNPSLKPNMATTYYKFMIFHLLIPWCCSLSTFKHYSYNYWRYRGVPHPNRTMKYFIEPALGPTITSRIKDAFAEVVSKTCIKFKEMPKCYGNRDTCKLVHFKVVKGECSATYATGQYQMVMLDPQKSYCAGAELHEVSHALGFTHEHQRPDRGAFVEVHVKPGEENSYAIKKETEGITPYDFLSVLHYKGKMALINGNLIRTIIPKDPNFLLSLDNKKENEDTLSFYDIMGMNKVYLCDEHCPGPNPCRPHSFRDSQCKCQCDALALQLADPTYLPHQLMHNRIDSLVGMKSDKTFQCLPSEQAFPKSECGFNWKKIGSTCYIKINQLLNWKQASDQCVSLGGRLASPSTAYKNIILEMEMASDENNWIDYNIWINAKFDETFQTWLWLDTGSPLTRVYTNWFRPSKDCWDKSPNCNEWDAEKCINDPFRAQTECPDWCNVCPAPISTNPKHCVVISQNDGKWRPKPCDYLHSFICQKPYGCENGWTRLNDKCYKLATHELLNWRRAKHLCNVQENAMIPHSKSEIENTFLSNLLSDGEWIPSKDFGVDYPKIESSYSYAWLKDYPWHASSWVPFFLGGTSVPWAGKWPTDPPYKPDDPWCHMLSRDGWWARRPCTDNVRAGVICMKSRIVDLGAESVTVCEGNWAIITCPVGSVIKIQRAFYGRENAHTCVSDSMKFKYPDWQLNTRCYSQEHVLYELIIRNCDGKQMCYQAVNNGLNDWIDPCPGTSKYLDVKFDCLQDPTAENAMCPNVKTDPHNKYGYLQRDDTGKWVPKNCSPHHKVWSSGNCGCTDNIQFQHASQGVRCYSGPRFEFLVVFYCWAKF